MEFLSDLKYYPPWLQILTGLWIVLTAIIVLGWFFVKPNKPFLPAQSVQSMPSTTIATVPSTDRISLVTVEEISKAYRSQPLMARSKFADNYSGFKVNWKLAIFSIDPDDKDPSTVHLALNPKGQFFPDIRFSVKLEDYPELKLAKRELPVEIWGKIKSVSWPTIYMQLDKMTFEPLQ